MYYTINERVRFMFNFPKNMSDAKIKRRLRVCQFCRDVFINLDKAGLSLYHKVNLNCNSAGIIISKVYLTEETYKGLFNAFGIDEYFNVKEYKKTLHISLNKKYIHEIDKLETLFKMQGII